MEKRSVFGKRTVLFVYIRPVAGVSRYLIVSQCRFRFNMTARLPWHFITLTLTT
jgi:hypothetical protein